MAYSFLFGGNTAETPQTLARKRAMLEALSAQVMGKTPKNAYEGIGAMLKGAAVGIGNHRTGQAEKASKSAADDLFNRIIGQAPDVSASSMLSPGIKPASTGTSSATAPTSPPPAVNISGSKAEFVNALLPAAIEESKRTGVDPRIIVAQAAQETGWGKSAPGNNFFGIKSHGKGGGQSLNTHEYVNGKRVNVTDSFRTFGSPGESVRGYGDFILENPRYKPLREAKGLDAQLAALQASGYATDPNYSSSVGAIARGIQLPQEVASLDPSIGMPPQTAAGAVNAMAAGGGAVLADESQYSPEDSARLAALRGPAPSSVPYSGPGARIDTPMAVYDDKGFRMEPQGQRPPALSLSDEVAAFEQTPDYRKQFPGMQQGQAPQGPIQNAPQQQPAIPPQFQGSQQLAGAQGGMMPALMGGAPASPEQVAQAQARGQQQPQPQPQQQGAPEQASLLRALSNPFLSDEQRAVLQTLYQQQVQEQEAAREQQIWMQRQQYEAEQKRNDPAYKIGLEKTLQEVENLKTPEYQTLTPEERKALGIADTDTRVYQRSRGGKIDAVGGAGQTINVGNEVDARKAAAESLGLTPEDPRYQSFVLTGKFPREDAQSLTATDKKAILEADEMVAANQSALDALTQAEALSDKANSGWFAGARASIGNNLPDWMVPDLISSPQSSQATTDMDNAIIGQAITQLKTIFGGNPTEGERNILLELQGSSTMPREVRKQVFSRARALAEKRLQFNNDRAADLRGGTYYKPDRAPATGQNIDDLLKKYGAQ